MGRVGSGPELLVNSGSGRVGSLHSCVGLGGVKKIGPTVIYSITILVFCAHSPM